MKKLMLVCLSVLLLFSCAAAEEIDYTNPDMWAYDGIGGDKAADLFLICPTVDMGKEGNFNMSLTDEKRMTSFLGALNMERGIYEEALTLYAPYYRQATFPVYAMTDEEGKEYFDIAYADVKNAFTVFLAKSDRPFVLAGFSQGSQMALRLLKEFPDCADRLIAAYLIGWRVTDADMQEAPHLRMAEGENDTGVIIAFNTESVSVTESLLVPAGVKTYAINPLNWKTDGTPAQKEENKGACFTDYSGNITTEIPYMTGAYLDETRGTLKAPDVNAAEYANSLFPDGVYHLYDYQFFYRNLQENVTVRVEEYFAQQMDKAA